MRTVVAGGPAKLEYFTAEQAAEVEAITAAIIPTTDTPGAREAGVIYFIDRSLRTFAADQQKPFAEALAAVDAKRKELFASSATFAALPHEQQNQVLKAIEKTPEFGQLQFATVVGFLCNPEDGGNRDMAGWKLVGFDHSPTHTPPFGYYDAEYAAQQKQKAAKKSAAVKP